MRINDFDWSNQKNEQKLKCEGFSDYFDSLNNFIKLEMPRHFKLLNNNLARIEALWRPLRILERFLRNYKFDSGAVDSNLGWEQKNPSFQILIFLVKLKK